MSKIETPRLWTSQRKIGLQRTCALVEEWSNLHNASIEIHADQDVMYAEPSPVLPGERVHLRVTERRYRVTRPSPAAASEANLIRGLIARRNAGVSIQQLQPIIRQLADAGYSETAVQEVLHANET